MHAAHCSIKASFINVHRGQDHGSEDEDEGASVERVIRGDRGAFGILAACPLGRTTNFGGRVSGFDCGCSTTTISSSKSDSCVRSITLFSTLSFAAFSASRRATCPEAQPFSSLARFSAAWKIRQSQCLKLGCMLCANLPLRPVDEVTCCPRSPFHLSDCSSIADRSFYASLPPPLPSAGPDVAVGCARRLFLIDGLWRRILLLHIRIAGGHHTLPPALIKFCRIARREGHEHCE